MKSFVPHPLIPSGQMQTVAALIGKIPEPTYHTEHHHVPLPDGDRLVISVDHHPFDNPKKPIIMLMHGLGGSGRSAYMLRHSHRLQQAGFTVVRFNHRGCGPASLDMAQNIYHSGRTGDIDAALQFLARLWPGRRCAAIGYSMSGNILLRYLGAGTHSEKGIKEGTRPPPHLSQALAICPPINLESCSHALASPRNWHIHRYLMHHITQQALALEWRRNPTKPFTFPARTTLRTFDEIYTAPQAGFASRSDYYATCSSEKVLSQIQIPTTILAAKDDPIVPSSLFRSISIPSHVQLRLEDGGGHMGFISREVTDLGDRRWMDSQVVAWARSLE